MNRRRERGATVVEAAVTMLLLFTLLFGIIEFGRAFLFYQTITDGAREGARYSVAPLAGTSTLPSTTDVEAYVNTFLNAAHVNGATVSINQTASSSMNNVVYTQVTVTAPYQFLFFSFGTMNLTSSAVMRNETN